ncbi:MAG: DNA repair exonuclease [Candidatus Bathyarchaeota archaeon]|nr:DNA repair exonuclease [Candidatus Bathyarchaeota archaeon A05DMB-3]MDH7606787.1 DNA repair exonuclease [Candidatus Bathyarchaeota archaeon]
MKAFSFVHAADLHLGYSQYGLEARREDFDRAFKELVDKTLELKPTFMIIAGDLFHGARPSNVTLENAIKNFSRLREAGISVLVVDGSHDSAPNVITSTILNPLDSAGLIYFLPRHEGACWRKPQCCYVYGVPNFRTRRKTEEMLPVFMEQNKPTPDSSLFNIFVFHMALEIPELNPPYIEAEAPPELIPEGFNYYAAGHVHTPYKGKFKNGMLVYPGSTETINYDEAKVEKGFYYVEVSENGEPSPQFIKLNSPRKFIVLEQDFTGVTAAKITELVVQLVKGADEEGAILVPVLRGVLPAETSRAEVDVAQIRSAAEKALLVHPVVLLRESEVPEAVVRSIFESEIKDLKTKSFEYFLQIFSERYSREEAEKIARAALNLIEPLTKKQDEKVKQVLEELI